MSTRRFFRRVVATLLPLFVMAIAAPAYAATEVYRNSASGLSAYASFFEMDGCIMTWMDVSAVDGRIKFRGKPEMTSSVSGYIEQYNLCEGTWQYGYYYVDLAADAFRVDKRLQSATLSTPVQACNDYWTCFPVEINVTWTGTSDTFREKSHSQFTAPHFKIKSSFDATTRLATSSGSVVTTRGTTSLEAQYATIRSVKDSTTALFKQ